MQPQNPINPQNIITPSEPDQNGYQRPVSYDFITNPEQPERKRSLPGSDSMLKRILILGGGIVILIILFGVVKNMIAGPPKLDYMITVAQDQQEIIHLTTNAHQQQDLSTANKNLAATSLVSLTSSQAQIIAYLTAQHLKVKPKTLRFKVSPTVDTQLINAEAAGTFNPTFQDVMQSQLKIYSGDLQRAYSQITGKVGRSLISDDYSQAQLLLSQITPAPASTTN